MTTTSVDDQLDCYYKNSALRQMADNTVINCEYYAFTGFNVFSYMAGQSPDTKLSAPSIDISARVEVIWLSPLTVNLTISSWVGKFYSAVFALSVFTALGWD